MNDPLIYLAYNAPTSFLLMMLGIGVFLGGFAAYCDSKVREDHAIGIMVCGVLVMLIGLGIAGRI